MPGFGWKRQLPDFRDAKFRLEPAPLGLPERLSWRDTCPPVFDQGDLGSCTANAISTALWFEGKPGFTPSRLFIYYGERELEGSIDYDAGAYIRDGFKVVASQGCAAEGRNTSGSWEYDIAKFREKPSPAAYNHALNHQAIVYRAVPQTRAAIQTAISQMHLVVFGFSVYDSFYDVGSDGMVAMPDAGERQVGGHAVTIVGYDNVAARYVVQNSWGTGWGDGGFMHMPYAYVESPDLADDFWCVETVETGLGR
jgi:C1A family cysteine protease